MCYNFGVYGEKVIKALNKHRLKYLVIGGIAVNLYGLTRLTRDLDLLIDVSAENLERFVKILNDLGYRTNIPRSKWEKLTAIAFLNKEDPTEKVDIFLKNPIDFKKAHKDRKVFVAGGIRISCISFEDLIKMKKRSDRIRDLIDIGSLKRIRKGK